jgi:peptidyl-dipeptidase Dcp
MPFVEVSLAAARSVRNALARANPFLRGEMKILLATTAILSMAAIGTAAQAQGAATPVAPVATAVPNNILLADWTGPYDGVPPFDKVTPALFPQAFEFAIAERRREVEAIANNPEAPTFANTVEALERSGQRLDRVESLFGVMTSNMSTPEYQSLDREWSPRLAGAYDENILNPNLFQRVKAIYEARETSGLNTQQQRLITRLYDSFVRRGANLDATQKQQLETAAQSYIATIPQGDRARAQENLRTHLGGVEAQVADAIRQQRAGAAATPAPGPAPGH